MPVSGVMPAFDEEIMLTWTDEDFRSKEPAIFEKPHAYLAISGGADKGAYGAGLLVGWTKNGTRPEFTMVTGVSTGALIAPFAFLGSDYDKQLQDVFTHTSTKDILKERSFSDYITNDGITDSAPLKKLIAHYIDNDFVEAIARESKIGRQLSIGTVNLEAGRAVTWNISAIAMSEHPGKVDLIHSILLASASIPIEFSPVMIPVESNGKIYHEMHVDGGVGSQVFLYPEKMDWKKVIKRYKVTGKPEVYVIRNAFIDPGYQTIEHDLISITGRAIDLLIKNQSIGDIYKIYSLCKRDNLHFNLIYMPSTFKESSNEFFDPIYMTKLFKFAENMAIEGVPWKNKPPGFDVK